MIRKIIKSRAVQSLKIFKFVYYFKYKNLDLRKQISVLSPKVTAQMISDQQLSLARYGDGEMRIIFEKRGIHFQKYDPNLATELLEALEKDSGYSVAIPHGFVTTDYDNFWTSIFWWKYVSQNVSNIKRLVNEYGSHQFLDTSFSRTVTELKDPKTINDVILAVKNIWNGKDVVMVEGAQTRFGAGNDLFENTNSVQRIIGPAKDAYSAIDEIEGAVYEAISDLDNAIVLVALGPTATALAHRLYKSGVQVVDIGHFDLQYEYYLRGARRRVNIPEKFDNELGTDGSDILNSNDEWSRQVVSDYSHRKAN